MSELYSIIIKNQDGIVRVNASGIDKETLNHIISDFHMFSDFYIAPFEPEPFNPKPKKKEERYQAYEDLAFNTNRDELAQSCAGFLKDYCNHTGSCLSCIFFKDAQCSLKYRDPENWELKEGEPDA